MHADVLDQRESLRGPFTGAVTLHLSVIGGLAAYAWIGVNHESFGDPNAGGMAVGIETVKSIPLPHSGPENPVAHDTQSQLPPQPVKEERAKKEPPPPKDAIALKSKTAKQLRAKVETPKRFKSFEEVDPNRIVAKQAQAVSNPMFSELSGAGRVGTGANSTLGSRFGEYSARIRQIVTQHWRTGDVDSSVRTAPQVIVSFDIQRDGTISTPSIVQSSGISILDSSARRAILEASPFPPLPPAFERSSAPFELVFELKR